MSLGIDVNFGDIEEAICRYLRSPDYVVSNFYKEGAMDPNKINVHVLDNGLLDSREAQAPVRVGITVYGRANDITGYEAKQVALQIKQKILEAPTVGVFTDEGALLDFVRSSFGPIRVTESDPWFLVTYELSFKGEN